MIPLHWITVLFAGAAGLAFAMPWDTCILSMIALAASYLFLLLRGTISLSSPILGPCINRGRPADHFALTFDDGPDPEGTHAVLDLLVHDGHLWDEVHTTLTLLLLPYNYRGVHRGQA